MGHRLRSTEHARQRRSADGRWAAAALLLAVLCLAQPARASWNGPRDVVLGTAETLEEGQFSIGVFSSLQYGVHDRVTAATHPVLNLLLTPNVNFRIKSVEQPVSVSLQLGYQQTFLDERDGGFPGLLHSEILVSGAPTGWLELTAQVGYAWAFFPTDHRSRFGGAAHFLMGRHDLLMLQVVGIYSATRTEWEWPAATLLYAHAWHTLRVGAGVSVGQFALTPWYDTELKPGGVPIYPVVDMWWRF